MQRKEGVAIYEQRLTDNDLIVGYEVFIIKKMDTREIKGTLIPAHEAFPLDKDFGITAWSTGRNYGRALVKYESLLKAHISKAA